jgi:ubiquinone/menaquinone biosynthesis C-methylase UbiE
MPTGDLQTKQPAPKVAKPYKGMAMEGPIARWYTKIRENDQERGAVVQKLNEALSPGSRVLEVAPGPGYLAIELARQGYRVVGLDISASFVQIASRKAREAGVAVDFHQGNASSMPFEADIFDCIICCAAFKNFTQPVEALREMHRVLRPGGRAVIMDLRRDAAPEVVNAYVDHMGLSWINTLLTKQTFKHVLLKNAYTRAEIRQLVSQTQFAHLDIRDDSIGMEIWLEK